MSEATEYCRDEGRSAGLSAESQSFASLACWCKFRMRRPANATIKVNSVEGGMCIALETSGAGISADAVLIIGLHDDDNSVRQ